VITAVLAVGVYASPSYALTLIPTSTLDPLTFDSGSLSGKLPASGLFSFTYTFTLTTTGLISPGVIITSTLASRLPTLTA